MTQGLHHITMIAADAQENVDFYAGFLGLRLVKRMAGSADELQLHLFYGDSQGSPGTVMTALVWPAAAPGRIGAGSASEVSFAIPRASLGFWLTRALSHGIRAEGPTSVFGEPRLSLRDPDGLAIHLVGVDEEASPGPELWAAPGIPAEHAIRRLRGAGMLTERRAEDEAFFARLGYRFAAEETGARRLVSESGDALDLRDASGFWTSAAGAGAVDHLAFRTQDSASLDAIERDLALRGPAHRADRRYFESLYVRAPGGLLVETATEGPGFLIDEPRESLGTRLLALPEDPEQAAEIRLRLPQFSMPGEPRMTLRDLPFIHRFHEPEGVEAPEETYILLHGTGGDESDLMPLARRVAPKARLLGLRGRSAEEGVNRWFRRLGMGRFDQADIVSEARALDAFVEEAQKAYGIDPDKTVWLGYSNGANMIGAFAQLHPGRVRRAILLRAMPALEIPPKADLSDLSALLITGTQDPYGDHGPALTTQLRGAGAAVEAHRLPTGHGLTNQDLRLAQAWAANA